MNTNLIASKTLNDIALLLYTQKNNETGIFAWIKEHKLITFIIICIIIFLWYKYKQITLKENFMFEFKNTLNDNHEYQLQADNSMTEPFIRPTFNPNYSVRSQKSYVRYLPNEYPRQSGNQLVDNSGKLIKNGGILPDQGISDISYEFSPIIRPQHKGPDYYDSSLLTSSNELNDNLLL